MEISKQWKKTVAEKDDYKYKCRDLRRENGELRRDEEAFHLVWSAIGVKETDDILRRAEQERQRAEEGKSTLLSQFRDLILAQKLTDDLM